VRQLFRRLNTQTPHPIDASVTRFRLWYFDSTGAQSNVLANLRSLRVLVNLQTQYENDSIRAGITWDRVFKPSNLR
jgi:hypothetical protein